MLYLMSSILLEFTACSDDDLFIVFASSGLVCLILVGTFLEELPDPDPEASKKPPASPVAKALAVTEFTFCNRRAVALAPLSISFGFAALFIASYVDADTVSAYIGTFAVGYCGVIQTATIAVLAMPFSHLSTIYGKGVVLAAGALCYILLAGAYIIFTPAQLGHWSYVAPLFVFYGIGRMTWENTAKAIFADFFPGPERTTAFANLNFVAGLSASVFAYLLAGGEDQGAVLGGLLLGPAILMLPGYLYARATPSAV